MLLLDITSSLDFGAILGQLLLRLRPTLKALTGYDFYIPPAECPEPYASTNRGSKTLSDRNSDTPILRCRSVSP